MCKVCTLVLYAILIVSLLVIAVACVSDCDRQYLNMSHFMS